MVLAKFWGKINCFLSFSWFLNLSKKTFYIFFIHLFILLIKKTSSSYILHKKSHWDQIRRHSSHHHRTQLSTIYFIERPRFQQTKNIIIKIKIQKKTLQHQQRVCLSIYIIIWIEQSIRTRKIILARAFTTIHINLQVSPVYPSWLFCLRISALASWFSWGCCCRCSCSFYFCRCFWSAKPIV